MVQSLNTLCNSHAAMASCRGQLPREWGTPACLRLGHGISAKASRSETSAYYIPNETVSSSVPQIFANMSLTPGSDLQSQTNCAWAKEKLGSVNIDLDEYLPDTY